LKFTDHRFGNIKYHTDGWKILCYLGAVSNLVSALEKIMNLTNHFIIAMPGLADPMFEKSVSFICQHNEQGAMGLTINRPTDIPFSELLSQLHIPLEDSSISSTPVYLGGPVETGHGFILHTKNSDKTWDQTLSINEHIGLSSSKDILTDIAKGSRYWQ